MRLAVWVESVLVMGLGALGVWEGVRLTQVVLRTPEPVGPGWYLLIVSSLLFVCGAKYLSEQLGTQAATSEGAGGFRFGPAAQSTGLIAAYAAATPIVGYLPCTIVFFTLATRIFGMHSWVKCIVLGIVLGGILQYVFGEFAGMVLP